MFPIDPGADATIGGMTATRASGTTAVRYGTMRENVLGLTVVLADGRVIRTGGRARKSSSGYDLTRLFVGSEGTLGVITEITLRLFGRPEAVACGGVPVREHGRARRRRSSRRFSWASRSRASRSSTSSSSTLVNRYSKTSYPLAPTLFFEFHGISQAVGRRTGARRRRRLRRRTARIDFQWASTPEERATLWQARHNVLYATMAMRPGAKPWTSDVCVPISQPVRRASSRRRRICGDRTSSRRSSGMPATATSI